ncbi:MAG: hypothetical protein KDB22_07410 [Planctomycetales bacterium]|nr:hypothetical protein [Planctomycetales bacterium]
MAAVRRFRMKYYRLVDRSFTLLAALVFPIACVAQESSLSPIATEQEACRRFNQMRDAFQHAETLSFESKYDVEVLGVARSAFTYRVWLKKPNYFRVECRSGGGTESGVIIGDGSTMWTYWPNGRPQFDFVNESAVQRADWKTSYMRKPATDASLISLAHEMPLLGAGMGFPIIDVSVFHGHCQWRFLAGPFWRGGWAVLLSGVGGLRLIRLGSSWISLRRSFLSRNR